MNILHNIKFESNLEHKTVYNWAMPYLMAPMMTSSKFLENLENK